LAIHLYGHLSFIFPNCIEADAFLLPQEDFLLVIGRWNMKLS
jgi:hypothetical protein